MGSVRTALVPLVAMPVSLIGAAIVMFALRLQPEPADDPRDRAVGRAGRGRRDRRRRERRAARARRASRAIEAALVGARELVGPIIAMTITLAAVYTPIGFQGGLTGSLFLEFAITLAAAVVVSGVVAVTLSPVMSSRFVHRARQGRPADARSSTAGSTRCAALRADARRGAARCAGRSSSRRCSSWLAAWPLYMFSRQELAPGRGPEPHQPVLRGVAGLDASRRPTASRSTGRRRASRRSPRREFMWSLTAAWGGFGGMVAKDWHERDALDRGDVRRGVRRGVAGARAARVPAARSAAADRRASTTSSSCCRATRRPSRCSRRPARCSAPAGRAASSCTSTPI